MLMTHRGNGIIIQNMTNGKEEKVTDLGLFYDLDAAEAFIREKGRTYTKGLWPESLVKADLELASSLLRPNITFNKRETALRKRRREIRQAILF